MNSPIEIFDRSLLNTRRRRANCQHTETNCDYLLGAVADDLIDRLSLIKREFGIVLNYGCHNGLLSHSLKQINGIGTIISSDGIYELAARLPTPSVVADEELFPFKAESFDLIVSALTLQWVNDLPGCLMQVRRGLKADGVFLGATLGSESLCELRQVLFQAEEEIYGGASPRVAPFADVRDLGQLLQRAGFSLPVTDRDIIKVNFPSPSKLMQELRQMGASNVLNNRLRSGAQRRLFSRASELYLEQFGDENGRVSATFEIIYLMGWAPHPDQQKPLQPGSASVSLTEIFEKKQLD